MFFVFKEGPVSILVTRLWTENQLVGIAFLDVVSWLRTCFESFIQMVEDFWMLCPGSEHVISDTCFACQ